MNRFDRPVEGSYSAVTAGKRVGAIKEQTGSEGEVLKRKEYPWGVMIYGYETFGDREWIVNLTAMIEPSQSAQWKQGVILATRKYVVLSNEEEKALYSREGKYGDVIVVASREEANADAEKWLAGMVQ